MSDNGIGYEKGAQFNIAIFVSCAHSCIYPICIICIRRNSVDYTDVIRYLPNHRQSDSCISGATFHDLYVRRRRKIYRSQPMISKQTEKQKRKETTNKIKWVNYQHKPIFRFYNATNPSILLLLLFQYSVFTRTYPFGLVRFVSFVRPIQWHPSLTGLFYRQSPMDAREYNTVGCMQCDKIKGERKKLWT